MPKRAKSHVTVRVDPFDLALLRELARHKSGPFKAGYSAVLRDMVSRECRVLWSRLKHQAEVNPEKRKIVKRLEEKAGSR